MIPRHRPPFGPWSLLRYGLRGLVDGRAAESLERAWCEHLQVDHAVWLPSARYGITRAIQLSPRPLANVYCPAFNCAAVHHAAEETGLAVVQTDCAPDSFLLANDVVADSASGYAVILSEMFGQRFSQTSMAARFIRDAGLRVFDMAMAIPETDDMDRLRHQDVAVISFGLGKSLYAGWGGLALTHSKDMADRLRESRDQDLAQYSIIEATKGHVQAAVRTVAHEPFVYRHLRRRPSDAPANIPRLTASSFEWHRPPSGFHLVAAAANLRRVPDIIRQRQELATAYVRQLAGDGRVVVPEMTSAALSHFSIRVPAVHRHTVRASLWDRGIDSGVLFPFPDHLVARHDYPYAAAAAEEIINLPLSNQLTTRKIERICDQLKRVLDQLDADAWTTDAEADGMRTAA